MAKLKSLTAHPPYGFQFLQPETGQTTPFTGSFNFVVEQVIMLRKANPFLAERHGWSTDTRAVEHEVEQYNVARCIAGGWLDFVLADDPNSPAPVYTPALEKKKRGPAVGSVKRVAAGVALLIEWLGNGAKPVEQELADKRAAICASCPKNGQGGITSYFTQPIAEKIRVQMEIRGDLQLRTPNDEKLGVCEACLCPLRLKVWTPIEHVIAHTSDEVKKELAPQCWILHQT